MRQVARSQRSEKKTGDTVQSVARALEILEAVSQRSEGVSLTDLSNSLGLNPSTCHHLVTTLMTYNYLDQDAASKRYLLGPKLLQLKNIAIEQADVYARSLPFLEELNRASRETVHLAVLRGGKLITLIKLKSLNAVAVDRTLIDESEALHCTATGKAILAFMPLADTRKLVGSEPFRVFTPKTITTWSALDEELQRVRQQGFALDLEEFETGICCIGAPIRDRLGAVVASFSVSAPAYRTDYKRIQELIGMVLRVADQISRRLGYQP